MSTFQQSKRVKLEDVTMPIFCSPTGMCKKKNCCKKYKKGKRCGKCPGRKN